MQRCVAALNAITSRLNIQAPRRLQSIDMGTGCVNIESQRPKAGAGRRLHPVWRLRDWRKRTPHVCSEVALNDMLETVPPNPRPAILLKWMLCGIL